MVLVSSIVVACAYNHEKDVQQLKKDSIHTTSNEISISDISVIKNSTAYQQIDSNLIKRRIKDLSLNRKASDIIRNYYPAKVASTEGFESITINERQSGDTTIVVLTHDNQPHVTVQGHRIELFLRKGKQGWTVLKIQQQFKCWKRTKGTRVWSSYPCS